MPEKRKIMRLQKRLKLRYGVKRATSLAFTEDFSEAGIFIRAVNVMLPGSTLQVDLSLPDNDTVSFEGRIVWGRRVPGSLIHFAKKSGMGLIITGFTANEDKYREFCRSQVARKKSLSMPRGSAPGSGTPAK